MVTILSCDSQFIHAFFYTNQHVLVLLLLSGQVGPQCSYKKEVWVFLKTKGGSLIGRGGYFKLLLDKKGFHSGIELLRYFDSLLAPCRR